jgi:two-component system chemotaxis sensor kinase CheA
MVNEELRELLDDFLVEADERLTRVEVSLLATVDAAPETRTVSFREVRRELHTLKGNSGMMGFGDLQTQAHALEDLVDDLDPDNPDLAPLLAGLDRFKTSLDSTARQSKQQPRAPTEHQPDRREGSTRVRVRLLSQLLETSTQLVLSRHALSDRILAGAALESGTADFVPRTRKSWQDAEEAWIQLDQILELLQEQIRGLRTIPLKSVFTRLQRLVHDESTKAGKEVRFETRGGETPLDSALTELATDTLGHLIRNCIVHGIETPEVRERNGKSRRGTLFLEASLRAGTVEIEVFDDGAGINEEALRQAAGRSGIPEAETADLHALLFHPGLSTSLETDQSSGRGIGLSAVLASAHRHGGTIEVDSSLGLGTRFCLRLPLTVAITDALLISAGRERFAIPIAAVKETGDRETLDSEDVLDLGKFLDLPFRSNDSGYFVTVESEGRSRSLLVDELGKLQRIVVSPLDDLFGRPRGIAGSTVLGDGRVTLILDPTELAVAPTTGGNVETSTTGESS